MSKPRFLVLMLAIAVPLTTVGSIFAANMGFKIFHPMVATGNPLPEGGTSFNGTNTMAIPWIPQTGMTMASDLLADMRAQPGGSVVANIQRFVNSDDTLCAFTGMKGSPCADFPLIVGECYYVKLAGGVDFTYPIVGSADETAVLTLLAPPAARSGTNSYPYPYHGTSVTARQLLTEIGPGVQNVQRFLRSTNTQCAYTGQKGTPCTSNFNLVAGECYRIKVGSNSIPFQPSHY